MTVYTHPQSEPIRLARYYRQYLMGQKGRWMAAGMGHRCLRALIKYRAYIEEYVAAKRLHCAMNQGGGG